MAMLDSQALSEAEHLHKLFQEKCAEHLELLGELSRAQLDAQQLRLRLIASGVLDVTLVPQQLRCGGGQKNDQQGLELKNLVTWLGESCHFQDPVTFDVGGTVSVGQRQARLGRMVSWPLSQGEQKLSLPQSMEQEIVPLLKRAGRGALSPAELRALAQTWEVVGADISSESGTRPAIFLIRNDTDEAAVIADWPPAMPAAMPPAFDPDAYFKGLDGATQQK